LLKIAKTNDHNTAPPQVLALHYKGVPNLPSSVTPGIDVVVTKKKPSKLARVFMLHSSKNSIAPHTTGVKNKI
jgi:hypothetical protein